MKLTEKQWQVVAPLFAEEDRNSKVGRPPVPPRDVPNGVLWILKTGARWRDLPRDYPPYRTCHRRFQTWVEEGTVSRALQALADDLREFRLLDTRYEHHAPSFLGFVQLGCLVILFRQF
jgi:transposase